MGPIFVDGITHEDARPTVIVPDYSFLSPCKKCMVRMMCKKICSPLKTFNKRKEHIKMIFPAASRVMFGIMAVAIGLLIFIKCMGEIRG